MPKPTKVIHIVIIVMVPDRIAKVKATVVAAAKTMPATDPVRSRIPVSHETAIEPIVHPVEKTSDKYPSRIGVTLWSS